MINIEGTSLSANGYAFHIQGNKFEDELCLLLSPSQARSSPIMAIAVSVDGGMQVMYQSTKGVPNPEVPQLLINLIMKWATQGIEPTAAQKGEIAQKAVDALNELLAHFGYDYGYVGLDAFGNLIDSE